MAVPPTTEQFLDIFAAYNGAIWPLQLVAYGLAALVVAAALFPARESDRFVTVTLASFWLMTGVGYHWAHFAPVNRFAYVFGLLFVLQAGVLINLGVRRDVLRFRLHATPAGLLGAALAVYATVAYPGVAALLGHAYPRLPLVGVAPCPTTIFTLGVLLWGDPRPHRGALAIPLLWALVGATAVPLWGMWEDTGLLVAAAATAVVAFRSSGAPALGRGAAADA